MKTFNLILFIVHLCAFICAIHMCCTNYTWYWLVIGLYAFGNAGNILCEFIENKQ